MGWATSCRCPWEAAAGSGAVVIFVPGLPVAGLYLPGLRVIALRHGLPARQAARALAEQLQHHQAMRHLSLILGAGR